MPTRSDDLKAPGFDDWCCRARKRFALGVVYADKTVDLSADEADLVVQWEPFIALRTKFCAFCGHKFTLRAPFRQVHT